VFFIASKIFWMLASPINVLLFSALAGVLLCYGRRARFGRGLALAAILILLAAAALPLCTLLIAPLENRFPQPSAEMKPPYGIIVLGGAIDDVTSAARGQTVFDEGGERITEAVILARRFPQARIVYTSGTNSVFGGSSSEAVRARDLMAQMGVAPERVTIEDKSRNTDENARFTAAIVHPEPWQRWLIVTSAFHMPRAMGVFEKAGFHPIAYPVSFRTLGRDDDNWNPIFDPARNLRIFELAVHEWIGLSAYWASGRIDHLFPGPGDAALLPAIAPLSVGVGLLSSFS
jgi:uncharacterized SAM-binding protein YcdF (DUF218 family)